MIFEKSSFDRRGVTHGLCTMDTSRISNDGAPETTRTVKHGKKTTSLSLTDEKAPVCRRIV